MRLIYLLCANADETYKLPPLVIEHAERPRAFRRKYGSDLGFDYWSNKNALMTAEGFTRSAHEFQGKDFADTSVCCRWLRRFDHEMQKPGRHIVVLVDKFKGHSVDASAWKPTNIKVIFFAANITSLLQPLDQGIIKSFKAHYRAL